MSSSEIKALKDSIADAVKCGYTRYCCSLNDVSDDYVAALNGKLPKAKVQTMKVLTNALDGTPRKDAAKLQTLLAPPLAAAAMEAAPEVREAALQVTSHLQGTGIFSQILVSCDVVWDVS